jgi:hypothetical protein
MNTGKTLFAQLMDFLPWTTFARIVERYGGDRYVKSLGCAEHFRVMAFAQLTYRESLRDIEACLSAQVSKLYHMGFHESRLAHLRRLRARADPSGQKALCGREPWGGTFGNGLRARFDHNRPLPVGLPLGAVPLDQGGRADAFDAVILVQVLVAPAAGGAWCPRPAGSCAARASWSPVRRWRPTTASTSG